jgi:hypothetical protein
MVIGRLKGRGIITRAAKHNLREIAAEIGHGRIDPLVSSENVRLRGPATAKEVAELRKSLLVAAKLNPTLRKNAVEGVEVLFTWPRPGHECPLQYFEDCTLWAEDHFQVPVLSSVIHLDESQPHCHLMLLPLINGHMNGSDMIGSSSDLRRHLDSFYQVVGTQYGFSRPVSQPRLSSATRDFIVDRVISTLNSISALTEETVRVLLEPHRKNPRTLQEHFKIPLQKESKKQRTFVEIFTAAVKPERSSYPYTTLSAV